MVQILRRDNPLFAPGLKFPQRLCYFNAMCHFLSAVPRLIFLTAPLIFLLLGRTNIPGYWAAILAYALPHLTLFTLTNSRIQGEHRYSFWNEIYETVLSPFILLPTLMAFISPKLGKFDVTAKGGIVKRTFFDVKIAQPFLILLLLNIAGLIVAIPRFQIWDRDRPGTVLMNVLWCLFNVIILGVCTAVARELRQLRTSVRVNVVIPVTAKLPGERTMAGETIDMSSGGTCIRFVEALDMAPETEVRLSFPLPSMDIDLPARVVSSEGSLLRVRFENLSMGEEQGLTMILYSRADSWLGWSESRESDNILHSLLRIFQISMCGLAAPFTSLFSNRDRKSNSHSIARPAAMFLAAAVLAGGGTRHLWAQARRPAHASPAAQQTAEAVAPAGQQPSATAAALNAPIPGQYDDHFTLAQAGAPQIELHGIDTLHNIYFTLPLTHVPRTALIHLDYAFSPALLPQLSHLKLMINGTLFATIQPQPGMTGGSSGEESQADFAIPPNLLVHNNTLTIEFIGHYTLVCEDPANTALWARVHRDSYLDIRGDLLPMANDLSQLPLPFLDASVVQPPGIPIVFPSAPSMMAIQAAGVISSYFGMISGNRPVRFPVHIGAIPPGNAIVIAENPASLPPGLGLPSVTAPTVAMRTNPDDPYSKILVVTGAGASQVVTAAQAVALHSDILSGALAKIDSLTLPGIQEADAAPRWARTNQTIPLWNYATAEQLQGDGTAPLNVYFRIPPDIFYANRPNSKLHLLYRYNSIPIGPNSSIQVRLNNAFFGSVPLIPGRVPTRTTTANVPIPVVDLRPFSNSLSFEFTFQLLKKGGCENTTPINMQGAILRDSYIDLRGYPHYARLPNLETFANAGFPFTRFADLSRTTVVLPPAPTRQEIETFATLMGHFGRQTGFPALRVTVAGPDALHTGASNNFLIIGTGGDQPAFVKLQSNLPVSLTSGQIQVRDTQSFLAPLHHAWWKLKSSQQPESGVLVAGTSPDAVIEGVESPYLPGGSRSIVAIHLRDASEFEPFMSTFLDVQQSSDISGSVAVLHAVSAAQDDAFQSFRVGSKVYYVGELPLWTRLTLWFMQVPWLGAVIVVVLAFLLAIWTRQWLRGRARARLRGSEE